MNATELDLINHYLSGKLPEADCVQLEARMIRDPDLRAEVELSRQLRTGLSELRQTGELDQLTTTSQRVWQRPTYGLAASVVAVLASIVAFASFERLSAIRDDLQAHTLSVSTAGEVAVLRLAQTRSAAGEADFTWTMDPQVGLLDLRIDVGLEPASSYALQLEQVSDAGLSTVLSAPSVAVTEGEVALTVNSALLQAGRYIVTVRDPAGFKARYEFDVIPQD